MSTAVAYSDEDLFGPAPLDDIRNTAAHYARNGLRVFPVKADTKQPMPGYRWKDRATKNVAHAVEDFEAACSLWTDDHVSVAWALGLDGYVALDLDVAEPPAWWADLEAVSAVNVTRRGRHLVAPFPDGLEPSNGTGNFPSSGWGEVRGVGGYIVIAGPDRPGFDERKLDGLAPFPKPEWLTAAGNTSPAVSSAEVAKFVAAHTAADHPKRLDGVRSFLDGWAPGKQRPLGVTFGTDARHYKKSRHDTAVDVACWIAKEAGAGDYPAGDGFGVLRAWWQEVMKDDRRRRDGDELDGVIAWGIGQVDLERTAPANVDPATGEILGGLPTEFWTARPVLGHIRTAAYSRMASPDAVLVAVLARYAALIPPTLRLPAIIGSESTFDLIGSVVATSAGGKSVAADVSSDLVPSERSNVLLDLPIGSGEGLVQSFFVPEIDDKGKPTGKQRIGIDAVHFTVDEGTSLMEQQSRSGTTIVQTLCSAWSGRELGQANAKAETRRIIPKRRVRVAAVINMQTDNGHLLLDDKMIAIGFPQRITFASAHDPSMPAVDDLPDWPGPIDYPTPPTIVTGSCLSVAPEIARELRERRHAIATGAGTEPPLDGHLGLMRLKIAGILTILDGRDHLDADDWRLAGMVVASSRQVREQLVAAKRITDSTRRRHAADSRAEFEDHVETVKERKNIARLADAIIRKVTEATEPITPRQLARLTTAAKTRHRFEAALDQAISRGAIRVEGDHVVAT